MQSDDRLVSPNDDDKHAKRASQSSGFDPQLVVLLLVGGVAFYTSDIRKVLIESTELEPYVCNRRGWQHNSNGCYA